ncbi:probable calcium-binding protein CML29 [Euphorbia lathyris]|uniref:probable calcium-binding protein CML29 n=1 Tax=Euphorbia lathyris TaxID=212925 RepID=UPI0033143A30
MAMAQAESISAEIETLSHVMSLLEAFRAFDSNYDGFITCAELGGILGSLGYRASEEDVREMMQQGDKNKDGLLSTQEFLDMNTKDMELCGLTNFLKTAFDAFNVDGAVDEAVTAEELYQVTGNGEFQLSFEDCQDILASMDGDGDGVVSFQDFKLIVNSLV